MATGDLYQVKLHQTSFVRRQPMLNVFWYEQTSGAGGADKLYEAFETEVRAVLATLQSSEVEHDKVEIINTGDPTDFHTEVYASAGGSVNGADTADFLAFGFRLERATRNLRHGYKRFAGVCEEHIDAGNLASSYATIASNVGTALAADIDDVAQANTFSPRIVRVTRTNPGVLPAQYSYLTGSIAGVTFYGFTTQNTRKR